MDHSRRFYRPPWNPRSFSRFRRDQHSTVYKNSPCSDTLCPMPMLDHNIEKSRVRQGRTKIPLFLTLSRGRGAV